MICFRLGDPIKQLDIFVMCQIFGPKTQCPLFFFIQAYMESQNPSEGEHLCLDSGTLVLNRINTIDVLQVCRPTKALSSYFV